MTKEVLVSRNLILKIKNAREAKGWSQRELSNAAKLSIGYIGMIEAGKMNPSLKALKKIAHALSLDPSYLIEEQPGLVVETFEDYLSLKEKEFIAQQKSKPWITLARELDEKGLTPEQVKRCVQLAMRFTEEIKKN